LAFLFYESFEDNFAYMKKENLIPHQHTGVDSNTSCSIELATTAEAQEVFLHARDNLLHVNKWHDLSGPATAYFQLTDHTGKAADREVQPGDFFKIDIPGPGNAQTGFDWVKVENVEEQLTHSYHVWTAIVVRPASPPIPAIKRTAHFFSDQATSSFIVERKGTIVKVCVIGKNEKVNEQSQGWIDTMRNTIIAFADMLGFNKPQWKSLVKGILRDSSGHHLQGRKTA
jgi:hypothetical protein